MYYPIAQSVDVVRGPGWMRYNQPMLYEGDSEAHVWTLTVTDNGSPAQLTGEAVAWFQRADGAAVRLKCEITGNVIRVTLKAQCYAVPGWMRGMIQHEDGAQVMTLAVAEFNVGDGHGNVVVDPGDRIPTLEEWNAIRAELEAAAYAIDNMTVSATIAATPTATITEVDGHKHITFGLPQGGGGSGGGSGAVYIPSVSADGVISWTNTGGLPNPDPIDIRGPQGERGADGAQGEAGERGEQGPQGPQGETGPAGPQGEPGPQGPQGEKGDSGTGIDIKGTFATVEALRQSVTDPQQGDMYNVGDYAPYTIYMWEASAGAWISQGQLQGPQGETGPAGPQGETGPQGPKGETGPAGPQGETGPAGPQGETGPAGPQGETGPAGPQGETGPAGPQGETGPAGPQGETGPAGPQGETGPAGPQGEPGVSYGTGWRITLTASGWSDNAQTVAVSGMPADSTANAVWVKPATKEDKENWLAADIWAAQTEGALVFECASVPAADINANVFLMEGVSGE